MDALAPERLRELGDPRAHPDDPSAPAGVEHRQTHISHVFLTRDRVVKLRKPVTLGFLDFGTRAQRNRDCLREVALNRRLAPDVYLGVAPILPASRVDGGCQVGRVGEDLVCDEKGEPFEHAVVMRRLPEGRDALSLLEAGRLDAVQIRGIATRLAAFHRANRLPRASEGPAEPWLRAWLDPVTENFRVLRESLPDEARVSAIEAAARAGFDRLRSRFEARIEAGCIVDGHGDVHLQHVWFEPEASSPVLIDCIEFDDRLRWLDPASEVAFLAMDLVYRGRDDLAERWLGAYAAEADDFGLYAVVDWFASYRAGVRAKVAALAAVDAAIAPEQRRDAEASARHHLELAADFLAPVEDGALVVLCGSVGTGKSHVATALFEAGVGVVIRSDRTRKHRAGLAPTDRSGAGVEQGLYASEATDRVYAALLECAAPVVASGRTAILDAGHALRRHRDAARSWAADRGIETRLVEVRCAEAEARRRLVRRQAEDRDASDAGPGLLAWSRDRFEAPDEWPRATWHGVATDRPGWEAALDRVAEGLPRRWHPSCKPDRG